MDPMQLIEFLMVGVGTVIASVVSVQHLRGWLPKRYRTQLAAIQRGVAVEIAMALKEQMDGLRGDLKAMPDALKTAEMELAVKMGEAVGDSFDTLSLKLEKIVPTIDATAIGGQISAGLAPAIAQATHEATDALAKDFAAALGTLVQEGFQGMTGALLEAFAKSGYSEMQKAAQTSKAEAAAAKVGARKFLAAAAGQIHPAAGMATALATSVIPDELVEEAANRLYEFLDANPNVLVKLNELGKNGLKIGGGSRGEIPR